MKYGLSRIRIRKFLKWLLNLKLTASNPALYGDIGRYQLRINMQIRTINYFLRHHSYKSNKCILSTMHYYMKEDRWRNGLH